MSGVQQRPDRILAERNQLPMRQIFQNRSDLIMPTAMVMVFQIVLMPSNVLVEHEVVRQVTTQRIHLRTTRGTAMGMEYLIERTQILALSSRTIAHPIHSILVGSAMSVWMKSIHPLTKSLPVSAVDSVEEGVFLCRLTIHHWRHDLRYRSSVTQSLTQPLIRGSQFSLR